MKDLALPAKVYIFATILAGVALCAGQFPVEVGQRLWLLLVIGALAGLAQIRLVQGPTANSNYDLGLVLYGFAMVELGTRDAVWIVLVAGLFAWRRDIWYTNLFNTGMWVISISAAGVVYTWVTAGQGPFGITGVLGLVAGNVIFTLVNHLMLALIIRLATGEKFSASGTFDRLTLTIDTTLFGIGTLAALVWRINPFATALIALPVYLIYLTLRMPALQRKADSDAKTGLFNSRYFTQSLQKELDRSGRFDRPLTVVMADLDYLRNINNAYGHMAGDVVLVGVANILRHSIRDFDLVARFGGEEFSLLMLEITPEQAVARIETLREAIQAAEFPVTTSLTPLKITMSFGLAGRGAVGQRAEEILHQADLAVYQAKKAGRNRVVIYQGEDRLDPDAAASRTDQI